MNVWNQMKNKIIVIKCSFCQYIQGSVPTYFHIFSKDSKFVECITFVIQISVLLHSYIPVLFFRQQINRNFYKNLDHVNTAFKIILLETIQMFDGFPFWIFPLMFERCWVGKYDLDISFYRISVSQVNLSLDLDSLRKFKILNWENFQYP